MSLELIDKLGMAGCDMMALFGTWPRTRSICKIQNAVIGPGPDKKPEIYTPRVCLPQAWMACRIWMELDVKVKAPRAVDQLPPQLSVGDKTR